MRSQIEDGRSWLWVEDDVIRFKAEASAWTPAAVQIQQVWVDPEARGNGYAKRGLRDLIRLLLDSTPVVHALRAHRQPAGDPAVRLDRHAARALVPEPPLPVKRAFFARHGESEYSARDLLNGDAAVAVGLTDAGRRAGAQARPGAARGAARPLHHDRSSRACVMTADLALGGRDVPRLVAAAS